MQATFDYHVLSSDHMWPSPAQVRTMMDSYKQLPSGNLLQLLKMAIYGNLWQLFPFKKVIFQYKKNPSLTRPGMAWNGWDVLMSRPLPIHDQSSSSHSLAANHSMLPLISHYLWQNAHLKINKIVGTGRRTTEKWKYTRLQKQSQVAGLSQNRISKQNVCHPFARKTKTFEEIPKC